MKKLLILSLLITTNTYAENWVTYLINLMKDSNMIQRDILSNECDINGLMRDLNRHTTGSSGWGNYQFRDYQSYGAGTRNWNLVMQMTERGGGDGGLGQSIDRLSREYPIDRNGFNRGVSSHIDQQYYALKSQTVLATRAASQFDYDRIQDQIEYQQLLQKQIEKTKDIKAAMDLSNRIQVEGNLINLEILRQVALANQVHAVSEQASVNGALSNAKFLTKE